MDEYPDDFKEELEPINPIEETISTFLLTKKTTEWLLAGKKIIMLLGSHPSIQDKQQDINNQLPSRPNRNSIRKGYVKTLAKASILQSGLIQSAEEEGIIDKLSSNEYEDKLCNKASKIIYALSVKGLIDLEKIISRPIGIELEGGGYRKGYR